MNVKDILKIELKPDKQYLIVLPHDMPKKVAQDLSKSMQQLGWKNNIFLAIPNGDKIKVIEKDIEIKNDNDVEAKEEDGGRAGDPLQPFRQPQSERSTLLAETGDQRLRREDN